MRLELGLGFGLGRGLDLRGSTSVSYDMVPFAHIARMFACAASWGFRLGLGSGIGSGCELMWWPRSVIRARVRARASLRSQPRQRLVDRFELYHAIADGLGVRLEAVRTQALGRPGPREDPVHASRELGER